MKALIYKDITKVLYMMKNHGIRFLYANGEDIHFECNYEEILENAWETFQYTPFWVHPEDVAKFEPINGDLVTGLWNVDGDTEWSPSCGYEESIPVREFIYDSDEDMQVDKIFARKGVAWLSPCEVRDDN